MANPDGFLVNEGSDDYRSVIDDLTIENRKLRNKLRHYEHAFPARMRGEKLFELRVHGVPSVKKRRLERTLEEFTTDKSNLAGEQTSPDLMETSGSTAMTNTKKELSASSSSNSNFRPVDSAYASTSASAAAASAPHVKHSEMPKSVRSSQTQRPRLPYPNKPATQGSLPSSSLLLSQKAKKQLVVKKLEQIFTGHGNPSPGSAMSEHEQEPRLPNGKDVTETNQLNAVEGNREAKIAVNSQDSRLISLPLPGPSHSDEFCSGRATGGNGTAPDQRPTRPIDLDLSRAPNAAENIEYMKHLGFESPKMDPDGTYEEGEGWISLNLLMSMAQLHILNVTPAFVRNAIIEFSAKFDVSDDGRNVRWMGGQECTRMDDENEDSNRMLENSPAIPGPVVEHELRRSPTELLEADPCHHLADVIPPMKNNSKTLHRPRHFSLGPHGEGVPYKPLFYHGEGIEDSSHRDSFRSPLPHEGDEDSCADEQNLLDDGADNIADNSRQMHLSGPIVYYAGVTFFTDLSGETTYRFDSLQSEDPGPSCVLGTCREDLGDQYERRGLLSSTESLNPWLTSFSDDSRTPTGIQSLSDSSEPTPPTSQEPCRLDVSGIGGVQPGDNLLIQVTREFICKPAQDICDRMVSVQTTDLAPASLPPPTYAFSACSSPSDTSNEDDSQDTISRNSGSRFKSEALFSPGSVSARHSASSPALIAEPEW